MTEETNRLKNFLAYLGVVVLVISSMMFLWTKDVQKRDALIDYLRHELRQHEIDHHEGKPQGDIK